jgi:hypothetical protein
MKPPRADSAPPTPKTALPATQDASRLQEELLVEAAANSRQLVASKAGYCAQRFLALLGEAAGGGYGELRAMLVTRSRQHVVWYTQALRAALAAAARQLPPELAGEWRRGVGLMADGTMALAAFA